MVAPATHIQRCQDCGIRSGAYKGFVEVDPDQVPPMRSLIATSIEGVNRLASDESQWVGMAKFDVTNVKGGRRRIDFCIVGALTSIQLFQQAYTTIIKSQGGTVQNIGDERNG